MNLHIYDTTLLVFLIQQFKQIIAGYHRATLSRKDEGGCPEKSPQIAKRKLHESFSDITH